MQGGWTLRAVDAGNALRHREELEVYGPETGAEVVRKVSGWAKSTACLAENIGYTFVSLLEI